VSSRSTLGSLHGKPGQVLMCVHAALQFVLNAGLKSHSEVFVILGDLIDVCAVSAQIALLLLVCTDLLQACCTCHKV